MTISLVPNSVGADNTGVRALEDVPVWLAPIPPGADMVGVTDLLYWDPIPGDKDLVEAFIIY